jgi:hypothetical protein
MSAPPEKFTLQFPAWYDELAEMDVFNKSHLSGVAVALLDGRRYPLCFVDSVYLCEEGHEWFEQGHACFAEPGLVIVPQVTREAMQRAVARLLKTHACVHSRPLLSAPQGGPGRWGNCPRLGRVAEALRRGKGPDRIFP